MRYLLLIAITLFVKISFSQIDTKDTIFRIDKYDNGKIRVNYSYVKYRNGYYLDGAFVELYENGKIKDSCVYKQGLIIGTQSFFDKKGRRTFEHIYLGDTIPRKVLTKAYYYTGICRFATGELLEVDSAKYITQGKSCFYWQNGNVMDSVIFKNNQKLFRARYSKFGKLEYTEEYPDNAKVGDEIKVTGYYENGSIKYIRKERVGVKGY